ncbi:MAG: ATP-dependent DNA helicase RecG, partial [Alphaproteobacteria bacterium]|nr:ATP-dependent DNA helicase RecG [Alphaproteobacteria bacterium]
TAPHLIEASIRCQDPAHPNHRISLEIVYFHTKGDYLRRTFPEGETRLISGKLTRRREQWVMLHPDYILTSDRVDALPNLEPIYGLSQSLSNRLFCQAINQALSGLPNLPEWHRAETLAEHQWPSFLFAMRRAHHPKTLEDLLGSETRSPALRRLASDELLAQQLSLRFMRQCYRHRHGVTYPDLHQFRDQVCASLPFQLSETQQNAIEEIRQDLQHPEPMLRLLLGEVSSGKTLVALMVMLDVLESGAKCALLVPSETLARQRQETLSSLLRRAGLDIPCLLLVGSLNASTKKEIYATLAYPGPVLVAGTHALIQDKVLFDNLGLVAIDEQHRFGVHQRMALSHKATPPPGVLVMNATPISRTLLMTHYGDLDATRLIGRNPRASAIKTAVIGNHRLQELIQRMHSVLENRQRIFWVCPLREESEKSDLAATENRYTILNKLFPRQCFLLHEEIPATQKAKTIADFHAAPNGAILVATTAVEVGIDIHDATTIIVEAAEHFGLAQLHQLRGGAGHAESPGTCVLLHGQHLSVVAKERLEMMRQSDDGFALAEADLRLRSGGEILGAKQNSLPQMRLADLARDQDLLKRAHDEAAYIVQHDPQLQTERGAALRVLLHLFQRDAVLSLIQAG